jgi:hypothetical protein
MPIHDWTRLRANRFHDFHQSWTIAIRNALNAGRLPPGYFAMVEQKPGGPEPDVITLELTPPAGVGSGGVAVEVSPPKTRVVTRSETAGPARRANRVTVRHRHGDIVGVVEIVSPGNKGSRAEFRSFVQKSADLIWHGVHLLVVDLFPPGKRDQGIHKVIWDRLRDEEFALPPDKPLTVAAYAAGTEPVGYVEPVAVGDALPEMPIFLTADRYVPCPLEESYRTAWEQFPAPLKGPLEAPPG